MQNLKFPIEKPKIPTCKPKVSHTNNFILNDIQIRNKQSLNIKKWYRANLSKIE
jgi:hypothetical protein